MNTKTFGFSKTILLGFIVFASFFFSQTVFAQARLYFFPSTANFVVGQTLSLNILLDTGGEDINAVSAYLDYPADILNALSVNTSESAFSLFAENSYKNGEVRLSAGEPSPGVNGIVKVATLNFEALKAGSVDLDFLNASVALSNSTNKDVLASFGSASIAVNNPSVIETPPASDPNNASEKENTSTTFIDENSKVEEAIEEEFADAVAAEEEEAKLEEAASLRGAYIVRDESVSTVPISSFPKTITIFVEGRGFELVLDNDDEAILIFFGEVAKVGYGEISEIELADGFRIFALASEDGIRLSLDPVYLEQELALGVGLPTEDGSDLDGISLARIFSAIGIGVLIVLALLGALIYKRRIRVKGAPTTNNPSTASSPTNNPSSSSRTNTTVDLSNTTNAKTPPDKQNEI